MFNYLRNKKGIVMPLVVILFAIVIILTTVTITAVNFESKHGIIDENQTKAYYVARSAVDAVRAAIEIEVQEKISDRISVVEAKSKAIDEIDSGDPDEMAEYLEALNQAVLDLQNAQYEYNLGLDFIRNHVLPVGGTTHTVEGIVGADTGDIVVNVIPVSGGYKLQASATVNGNTARAALKLNFDTDNETYSILINSEETTSTWEEYELPANHPASFGDAFYSHNNVNLGNNVDLTKSNGTKASGRYEGIINIGNNKLGDFSQSEPTDPIEPKELLPVDISTDSRFEDLKTTDLPPTIRAIDSGYYGSIALGHNKHFTVDTTEGDVILMLNRLEFGNNNSFHVTGSGKFYLYIYDNSKSDGGITFSSGNKPTFTQDNMSGGAIPLTYIIIDQPEDDRDVENNKIIVRNSIKLYGYLYAPYSSFQFQNTKNSEPVVHGSIVAGNISGGNNIGIVHIDPSSGSGGSGGEGSTGYNRVDTTTPIQIVHHSVTVAVPKPDSMKVFWLPQ
ncbi:DUF7305 domain-containing protein [Natronincola ferrireducens]|uniref:DUF7305 domain-containing protein n=1 Tax=Natronincola ferrireducens TaxID=393762 RepID=A0A1G9CLH9_9FIRM|nr:hypothetical protein [Natronincola ferrireducens]SDK52446.1 hypothetical protein SAMN05660472_01496 [Natronincola ferrireducens]